MVADPAPVGERQHEVAVEPAGLSEVDVLDARCVTQPSAPQPVGELARGALGELAVDLAMPAQRSWWSLSTVG